MPGRVNRIGEHTDYNGGFVMPAAIDLVTYVAVRACAEPKLVVDQKISATMGGPPIDKPLASWCRMEARSPANRPPVDLVITGKGSVNSEPHPRSGVSSARLISGSRSRYRGI